MDDKEKQDKKDTVGWQCHGDCNGEKKDKANKWFVYFIVAYIAIFRCVTFLPIYYIVLIFGFLDLLLVMQILNSQVELEILEILFWIIESNRIKLTLYFEFIVWLWISKIVTIFCSGTIKGLWKFSILEWKTFLKSL